MGREAREDRTMNGENSVKALATAARGWFETNTRTSTGKEFWCVKDGAPEWVEDMAMEAHGGMGADDWRYTFIVEALDSLEDSDPDEIDMEPDVYTYELTDWLGSRADRYSYCDEAMEEVGGEFIGTIDLLQSGQVREKREVLDSIVHTLESMVHLAEEDEIDMEDDAAQEAENDRAIADHDASFTG
jgi:hypothetical protein